MFAARIPKRAAPRRTSMTSIRSVPGTGAIGDVPASVVCAGAADCVEGDPSSPAGSLVPGPPSLLVSSSSSVSDTPPPRLAPQEDTSLSSRKIQRMRVACADVVDAASGTPGKRRDGPWPTPPPGSKGRPRQGPPVTSENGPPQSEQEIGLAVVEVEPLAPACRVGDGIVGV